MMSLIYTKEMHDWFGTPYWVKEEMKMRTLTILLGLVLCLPSVGADKKPLTKEKSARHAKVIEAAIRIAAKKPTGELTKEDFEKVTNLWLENKKLTSVKGLEKLTQLKVLHLYNNKLTDVTGLEKLTQLKGLMLKANPDLTKAQIDELKKALPKCKIYSNPTK